jgi:hypothetical protein
MAVAQGGSRINTMLDKSTNQPTVEDSIELLAFADTKAWFDALGGCGNGVAGAKLEL